MATKMKFKGLMRFLAGLQTDTIAEDTAAAGVTIDGLLVKDGAIESDDIVIATVAVTGGTGGATAGALTCSLTDIGGTDITAARRVLLVTRAAQYQPADALVSTVTFSTATTGSIVASGNGWALVQTDASGDFACTIDDTADETVYTAAIAPVGGGAASVHAIESNDAAGTWSA